MLGREKRERVCVCEEEREREREKRERNNLFTTFVVAFSAPGVFESGGKRELQ